ncbi:MFS transporter [Actinoplanes sp. NPDC049599]|uniref:MFS transporter n=1 Tax=Actinoplanes sp. NPDC049599 TaxID=3363903 RepID=UPI0037ADEB0D
MNVSKKFGVLADRPFRLVWIGRSSSALGDALMPVTQTFAVLSIGGGAAEIGLILAISMVVRTLLLLAGGALADRLPRRLLLGGTSLFLGVVQTLVGILLLTGRLDMQMLLAAAVCYGGASALTKPALTGLVRQTVTDERLQEANGLLEMTRGATLVVGPALAGVAVSLTSPGWVYLADALTFLVCAVAMMMLPLAHVQRTDSSSLLKDIAAGWGELKARPWYWVTLCCHAVWNVGSSAFYVLGPVLVAQAAGGAASWGVVSAGAAVGALVGGGAAMRFRPDRPLVAAHASLLLMLLPLAALAVGAPIAVLTVCAVVGTAGVTFMNSAWTATTQQLIPDAVLSRVTSYDWLISFTLAPVGFAAIGPVADRVGATWAIGIATMFVILGVGIVLFIPRVRRLRRSPDGKLRGWPDLDQESPAGPAPEPAGNKESTPLERDRS